jgi:hypothetical protein
MGLILLSQELDLRISLMREIVLTSGSYLYLNPKGCFMFINLLKKHDLMDELELVWDFRTIIDNHSKFMGMEIRWDTKLDFKFIRVM